MGSKARPLVTRLLDRLSADLLCRDLEATHRKHAAFAGAHAVADRIVSLADPGSPRIASATALRKAMC